ncbi:Sensor protein ChvG [Candidatus Filomicrobium marinum]|uniref:histidine kinase n=2 Tax=Filomicrobium TaxID=119044 RepID=A0A0D6JE66_9HYPH|nr:MULTISPECIES: stimulus-sensing domain-containing protein [Filomicrobium]CFX19654.1 Sensor protein ChvG [Candidatus Filomicrobium marinum]CPR18544.1 Sensor protein ChvG [Candidatus Filomicrobium marinum]SDO17435.1 two-component system, OmpR family, sensor histidine kinase ChvG [Filomicrobium insigne]
MAFGGDREASGNWLMGVRDSVQRHVMSLPDLARPALENLPERSGLNTIPVPGRVKSFFAAFRKGGPVRRALVDWFNRQPLVRFISASLLRRIMVSNLLGFVILFGGMVYLSFNSGWLINAKREALRIQGQIIAAAIAGEAKIERGMIVVDPDRLPTDKNARIPFRDDGFAALELSISPEKVAPIFRRLTQPTSTRARIYDRSGNLVVDTDDLLKPGQIKRLAVQETTETEAERPTTKDFWTRLQHWLIDKEVQVYKEIGSANGKYYPEVRQALQGDDAAMLLLNAKGQQIVSIAVPIQRMNTVLGVLLLSSPPGEVDKILSDWRDGLWPLAGIALVASILTGFMLARTVAGPMKRLSESAEHVSRDIKARQSLPAFTGRKDEVGQMASAFGAMTESLYRRIESSEKFAADVAHELKNPLTAASSTAQALTYAKTDEQRDMLVEQIQGELTRLSRLITDVSRASRLDAELALQSQEPVDLSEILSQVLSIFQDKAEKYDCKLKFILDDPEARGLIVNGNAGRLAQVFTNLVDNAISFSPSGGSVVVKAIAMGGQIEIRVEDDGCGIEEDKLETIFSRFYTYRPTEHSSRGSNSGLGLSISREIIMAHSGTISAENRPSADPNAGPLGSRFTVRLPTQEPPARGGKTSGRRA